MNEFERLGKRDRDLKWANIWFEKLAKFHKRPDEPMWEFTAKDVIAFSRYKLNLKCEAWKREKMVRGLIVYREVVQRRAPGDLLPVATKLSESVAMSRARDDGAESSVVL